VDLTFVLGARVMLDRVQPLGCNHRVAAERRQREHRGPRLVPTSRAVDIDISHSALQRRPLDKRPATTTNERRQKLHSEYTVV
jgi:hypothetical protein